MSKTYNVIRLVNYKLVNYKLAKLHLKLSKEGESIKFSSKEFQNLTVERKNECRHV